VIAFQGGLYSAATAWRALQSSVDPREALQQAVSALLSQSAQAEPLIEYLDAHARGPRPLELAGFDSQLTGTAPRTLLPELRRFLALRLPNSTLLDSAALPHRVLAGLLDGRFMRDRATLPSRAEQGAAAEALRATALDLERATADSESAFWAQVLRSTASQIGLTLDNLRGAPAPQYLPGLVRQMGENLVWLVNSKYANRKVIVWSHTLHAMRAPDATRHGNALGYTVGHAVWEALGDESFAIGLTSYDGASHWITQPDDYVQSIIPDQEPGDAFETLMATAGHDVAFVNLRAARAQGTWLGGRFLANALYLVPNDAEWSKALDAFLFIRTQQPRRRAN